MGSSRAERERRLLNRLTAIKLAQQMVERHTELTPRQRWLVRTTLEACDELTRELLMEPGWEARQPVNGRTNGLTVSPAPPDRAAHRTEDRLARPRPTGTVDALVIAPDEYEREALADLLASRGYVVREFRRVDREVEQLLAERRRLVVLRPDPDVGQAEIEAQVRTLRAANANAAMLVCLGRDQAPRALDGEAMTVLRRPFDARELLHRAAELYPVGPPRRATARRLPS